METLSDLIENLDKNEKIQFKKYLTLHAEKDNKYLQLFELVEKKTNISNEEAMKKLYGKNTKSYFMLKTRLINKILDFLALDKNLEISDERLTVSFQSIILRKQFIKAQILWERGIRSYILEETLMEILEKALESYSHDIALEVAIYLRRMDFNYQCNGKNINTIVNELRKAYNAEIIAGEVFSFYAQNAEKLSTVQEIKNHFQRLMPELEQAIQGVNSPRAEWIYLYTLSEVQRVEHKFKDALQNISKCIQIAENHPKVVSNLQKGNFYYRKAAILFQNLQFEEAKIAFQSAFDIYPPKRMNSYIVKKYLAIIELLQGNLSVAKNILQELITPDSLKMMPYHTNLCKIYLAIAYFMEKNFKQAWFILPELDFLLEDKGGFHGYIRIFELILLIEREDFEVVNLKLDSFRKYLKKFNPDNKYLDLVYQIFNKLNLISYDYKTFSKDRLLQELKNCYWDPLDYEPIHFYSWIQSKIHQQDYINAWKETYQVLSTQKRNLLF
jgi:tetratricopeptide (TPR) repeat protein